MKNSNNTGNRNTGDCNTGDWDTGDRNHGEALLPSALVTKYFSYGIPLEAADFQEQVADMNDSGPSFTEIADWIEENLHV